MGLGLGFSEALDCNVMMLIIIKLISAIAGLLSYIGIEFGQNPEEEEHDEDEVDPVTKVASTHEISTALGGEIEGVTCTVCLNDIKIDGEIWKLRSGCHVFHRVCLDQWIHLNNLTCPLCRSFLLPPAIQQ